MYRWSSRSYDPFLLLEQALEQARERALVPATTCRQLSPSGVRSYDSCQLEQVPVRAPVRELGPVQVRELGNRHSRNCLDNQESAWGCRAGPCGYGGENGSW